MKLYASESRVNSQMGPSTAGCSNVNHEGHKMGILLNTPPYGTPAMLNTQLLPLNSPGGAPWRYVRQRFRAFHTNLQLTADQIEDGGTKYRGVVACLNRNYWGEPSEIWYHELVGSWSKGTRQRPPRDVDLIFELPVAVYYRFEQRTGNRQSQLLQEVRDVLLASYPQTRIRGDGQVVVIPFNSYSIEVAPGFQATGGGFLICDTNNGGQYKWVHPAAELADFNAADQRFNGNVRKLAQMFKQWQRHCSVPIKSFHIEAIVKETLANVSYGGYDEFWFDWLVRDVFAHMIRRANGIFFMPLTGEVISLGNEWLSRAETAYARALKACAYEYGNNELAAGEEWQKVFGTMISQTLS